MMIRELFDKIEIISTKYKDKLYKSLRIHLKL